MRHLALIPLFAAGLFLGGSSRANAEFVAQHLGANDPTAEGFVVSNFAGTGTVGPITGDSGYDAWEIHAVGSTTQAAYIKSLSPTQTSDALTTGWTLTMAARVLASPAHEAGASAAASFGGVRFDINVFLDANGAATVRLDTSISDSGTGVFQTDGPTYTLAGSGSSYDTYSLVYDPVTQTADLFVDGIQRITGYAGTTDFATGEAVYFVSAYDGIGRFNLVELETGTAAAAPEPSSMVMLGGLGVVTGIGALFRRRRQRIVVRADSCLS